MNHPRIQILSSISFFLNVLLSTTYHLDVLAEQMLLSTMCRRVQRIPLYFHQLMFALGLSLLSDQLLTTLTYI
jgi:hypothetical protein